MNKTIFLAIAIFSAMATFSACGGNENKSVENTASSETKSGSEEKSDISAQGGEEIYKKTCIACHQANGEGIPNTFPPLAKADFLANRESVIEQVIKGKSGEMIVNGITYNNTMPPQALSDEEIASVLTYVYSSWGNSGEAVSADEVKTIRGKVQ